MDKKLQGYGLNGEIGIWGCSYMEVYVFDRNLILHGLLESYTSLIWRRRYSNHGNFELHCSLTPENLELLKKDNIIWKNDDKEAGYIQYRNLALNSNGDEVLVVQGKFLTGYLSRRIIWGTENLNMASELAIRQLINNNAINPFNTDRKINLMALDKIKGYTQTTNMQTSYKNLLDEIEDIANISELGIKTLLDLQNKQLIFNIYEGLDRTSGNGVNTPAIFSTTYDNVFEQEYTDSSLDYRNVALIAGEGEGAERKTTVVGEGADLDRYEVYFDARDIQSKEEDETIMPEAEYLQLLRDRGNDKLSEYKDVQTFDSKINLNSNLVYKEDFDLGDKVTCVNKKWGITIDTRITEIEEVYENTGKQVNVVFGNSMPTLIDKIRKVI